MSERLRDLLERAVPDDAPVFEPHALAATARRRRDRCRAVGAGLAVLVLAGVAGGAVIGTRGDDRDRMATDPPRDPYGVPACPAPLPEPTDAVTEVDSLAGVTAVRLCPDSGPDPAPGTLAELAALDALVEVEDLAERVAATADFDPGRCAAISVVSDRQSLQFTYTDGRSVLVAAGACSPVTVAGHEVDGGHLVGTYLDALDAQRDDRAYRHAYDGPLTCGVPQVPNVARPGRERIVGGGVCRVDDQEATPLDAGQLRMVDDAWGRPDRRTDESCAAPGTAPQLVLVTDRGDVVRLQDDGCAPSRLAWHGWDADGAVLPLSTAELGITP